MLQIWYWHYIIYYNLIKNHKMITFCETAVYPWTRQKCNCTVIVFSNSKKSKIVLFSSDFDKWWLYFWLTMTCVKTYAYTKLYNWFLRNLTSKILNSQYFETKHSFMFYQYFPSITKLCHQDLYQVSKHSHNPLLTYQCCLWKNYTTDRG